MMEASNKTQPSATAGRIEAAALQVFYERGYSGASIRDISARSGLATASLFHHFSSTEAILESILETAVDVLRVELDEALNGLTDPAQRVSTSVRVLVLSHCERIQQSFVAQSELRSLSGAASDRVRSKRSGVQRTLDGAILDGIASGQFNSENPRETSRAILSMCTQVATWYRPSGPLSPNEVSAIYIGLTLRMLGHGPGRDLA